MIGLKPKVRDHGKAKRGGAWNGVMGRDNCGTCLVWEKKQSIA
jgi:hypothetical protein